MQFWDVIDQSFAVQKLIGYHNLNLQVYFDVGQAEVKVKAGLYVHIINFGTSCQLLTVKCFYTN